MAPGTNRRTRPAARTRSTSPAPGRGDDPRRALIAAYLAHLTHERRLSGHTTAGYARDLEALLAHAGERAFAALQAQDIRRAIAALHGGGLDARSIARMLSAWRGFYRYLARMRHCTHDPCAGLRAPRAARRLPQALSPDEAARLLAMTTAGALDERDRAIFELIYSSGLRLAEVTGLAPGDVDFRDGTVRVTGKGVKTRIVPVGSHALAALRTWLAARAALPGRDRDALFVSLRGGRLSARAVQQRLQAWSRRQGLATRVHPHVLRHSFASHVLQSSGDLRAVQEMLGHASIGTTQVYTHLDFQHLARVYDAAHPRARMRTATDDTPAPPRGRAPGPRRSTR